MSNFLRTKEWLQACGKTPCKEDLSVQIGCHIEEMAEFLSTLEVTKGKDSCTAVVHKLVRDLMFLSSTIKKGYRTAGIADREQCLDALCDMEVTGNGVAYLAGFDKPEADAEVLAANDRKLVNGKPVILDGGKIGKPEGWKPANVEPFV